MSQNKSRTMRRPIWLLLLLFIGLWARPAAAQSSLQERFIVRTNLGLSGLQNICLLEGCTVVGNLDGTLNQVFLVTTPLGIDPYAFLDILRLLPGIVDAEIDQVLMIPASPATATAPPLGLWNSTPVNYFGNTVWNGYANQPATQIIRLNQAQSAFDVTGGAIVADIDTGVDFSHPALQGVLLYGYDFTRNQPGGSEMADITDPVFSACNGCEPAYVNQSTAAMLDQSTAAMLDGTPDVAFGHGTMVAGVIHLVAPKTMILPLKTFRSDGTGYLSDILRAIYYAVQNHAQVINMSFDFTTYSGELARAINYAGGKNVICVASAGNDGKEELVYPAGLKYVMGVASTNDLDQRSLFSNYGNSIVWVAAPGEGIVTTYPFGAYSAGWGTSFSAPFVAGTVALLLNERKNLSFYQASSSIALAQWIGYNMGHGRLDVYRAVQSLSSNSLD